MATAWLLGMLLPSEVMAELFLVTDDAWVIGTPLPFEGCEVELLVGVNTPWLVGTVDIVLLSVGGETGEDVEVAVIVVTVVSREDLSSMVKFRKSLPILSIKILKGKKRNKFNFLLVCEV